MRLLSIVGARPQFIKAAMISHSLREKPGIEHQLVHTGQHYDDEMSRIFFDELDIPEPVRNLEVGSGPHGRQTGRMIEAVEPVIEDLDPDTVLLYGDTNSTVAGALAASKLDPAVAHVEAGLRSFNRSMPEEINRVLTDHASDLLFAPTRLAMENLEREGLGERSHLVGDVMYDAALHYSGDAETSDRITARHGVEGGSYLLATVHRAENTDDRERLAAIFAALAEIAEDVPVLVPLHPRTRLALDDCGLMERVADTLEVSAPVGYVDMLALEKNAAAIVTDSGGIQKEAFFQRTPCVTVRDETEWSELVEGGYNVVVSPESPDRIVEAVNAMFDRTFDWDTDLYGKGRAAEGIVELLEGRRPGAS